ncbi:MAG: alanine racemase [Wujia sp.]
MDPFMGRTAAVIDLAKLRNNLNEIRKKLDDGVEVMAVLKGDGYRHGAVGLYPTLKANGVTSFAVALWSEGAALRECGATEPILVLGDTRDFDLDEAVRFNLDFPVFSVEYAKKVAQAAKRQGRKQNVQIKLDTGMSRIGFAANEESLEAIREISQMEDLRLTGIFTHFSRADEADLVSAQKQLDVFKEMTEKLRKMGITFPKYHIANSPAILNMPQAQLDMVRAGDILYGLNPVDTEQFSKENFQEILSWYTYVVMVKEVPAGTEVGYGATYVTKRPTKIATLPIGFADGYRRDLSNRGKVLIRGKEAPIIGRICMDQCMVDVTDIPGVERNDQVTLLGGSLSIQWMADLLETNVDEIVCNISQRVPRVYIDSEQEDGVE